MKKYNLIIVMILVMSLFTVASVAEGAFVLNLPANLEVIDTEAFEGTSAIEQVVVPDGTTEIRSRAFADSSLVQISLPGSVKSIAEDAFDGCEGLIVLADEGTYAYDWCVDHGFIKEGLAIISLKSSFDKDVKVGDEVLWVVQTAGGTGNISYRFDVFRDNKLIDSQYYGSKNYYSLVVDKPGTYRIEATCRDEKGTLSQQAENTITVFERTVQISEIVGNVGTVVAGETLNWNVKTEDGKAPIQYRYEVLKDGVSIAIQEFSEQSTYSYLAEDSGSYVLSVECKDANGKSDSSMSSEITVYSYEEAYPTAPELVFDAENTAFSKDEEYPAEYNPQKILLIWNKVENADNYSLELCQKMGTEWISILNEELIGETSYAIPSSLFTPLTERTVFRLSLASHGLRDGESEYYYFAINPIIIDETITVNGLSSLTWNQGSGLASARTLSVISEFEWNARCDADWISIKQGEDAITVEIAENSGAEERFATILLDNGINSASISINQGIAKAAPSVTSPMVFSTDINNPSEYPVGDFMLRWDIKEYTYVRIRISEMLANGSLRKIYDNVSDDEFYSLTKINLGEDFKVDATYVFELAGVYSRGYANNELEQDILKNTYYVRMTEDGHTIKVNDRTAVSYNDILSVSCFVTASNYFRCETDAEWLSVSETAVKEHSDSISIRAELNDTGSTRTGHVYFICGSATATVTVIQKDMSLKILYPESVSKNESNPTKLYMDMNLLDTNYFYFFYQGEDLYVEPYINGAYGEKTRVASHSEYGTYYAEVETDDIALSSRCRITVTYSSYSEYYYVSFHDSDTKYYDAFINPYMTREEGAHRHTITVYPDCSTSWTLTSNASWLVPSARSGVAGSSPITVEIAENTTGMPRTGRLTFKSTKNDSVKWQDIIQYGENYFALSYQNPDSGDYELYDDSKHCTEVYKGSGETTKNFKVFGVDDIDVKCNVSWISSTDSSPESGGTFKLKITKNPAGNGMRTGIVTVTNGINSTTITITQAPVLGEVVLVAPSISTDYKNPSVVQYADIPITWKHVENAVRYRVRTPDVVADVEDNGASQYSCIVPKEYLVPFEDNHITIAAYDQYGYQVSEVFYFIPTTGDAVLINGSSAPVWENATDVAVSKDFVIQSSADWTASANQSWIILSSATGAAGDTLTVTLAENTSSSSRSGKVTVTVNGKSGVLNISQCAYLAAEYPALSSPVYSKDKANPSIITMDGNSLTFNWNYEPQAVYYELTLCKQKSSTVRTVIAESETLDNGESSYTFADLDLDKGELYSITILRYSDRWRSTAASYYFTLADNDAWVLVDGEESYAMEEDGTENAQYFDITASGYWSAQTQDDWIMLYREPIGQDELDEKGYESTHYSKYSNISGENLCVSMLSNPSGAPRTGTVTVSCGGATAIITVYQYQNYTLATMTSPDLGTKSSEAVPIEYGEVNLKWSDGEGGTGSYMISLYESETKTLGYSKVFSVENISSNSYTIPLNTLNENKYYRVYLGTEITEDDYLGKSYYFYMKRENELSLTASLTKTSVLPGELFGINATASGGGGDYEYFYILMKDGEEITRSMPDAGDYYSFSPTEIGNYYVIVYASDADGTVVTYETENVSVSAVSATATPTPPATIAPEVTVTPTPTTSGGTDTYTISISQNTWNMLNPSSAWLNLKITTEGNWTVSGLPDWITINQTSGSGNTTVALNAAYNNAPTRTASITFAVNGDAKVLNVAQVGNDVAALVKDVKVSDSNPMTGEMVTFTITTENADEVVFMVDGIYYDSITVINDKVTYQRAFSVGGKRAVQFVPRRDGNVGIFSETLMMDVESKGVLSSPVFGKIGDVNFGDGVTVDWNDVPNAEYYTVYLNQYGNTVYKEAEWKKSEITLAFEQLSNVGSYTLLVMPCATGYTQGEGAIILQVVEPEKTFKLVEPRQNDPFDVGNKVDIKISNPDGYMLQAQVSKDGIVTNVFPAGGPANDLNPLYSFNPKEGGEYEITILAYNSTGKYKWGELDTPVTINVEGPAFKSGSRIGTGARGMLVENANSFKIVTNTAVTKVVVNDGIQDYVAEKPVLNTSGGWTHTFTGTLDLLTEGKHIYTITAYDNYNHSVTLDRTVYLVKAVTKNTQYPQASKVFITEAPDQSDAIAILYPSDQATILGQCGNYWYVEFEGIKGFVAKTLLNTTRMTSWDGLELSFSIAKPGEQYVYSPYGFNVKWNCAIDLPDSAVFRLYLVDVETGEASLLYIGNDKKWSGTVSYMSNGRYYLALSVGMRDRLIFEQFVETGSIFKLTNSAQEYVRNIDENGYYDKDLQSIENMATVLINSHLFFTTGYMSNGQKIGPVNYDTLTENIAGGYQVLFGDASTALESRFVRCTYIAEQIMAENSRASGAGISVPIKVVKDVYKKIFNMDMDDSLVTLLSIASFNGSENMYLSQQNYKTIEDSMKAFWKSGDYRQFNSELNSALKYTEAFISILEKYVIYSRVDQTKINTIIDSLENTKIAGIEAKNDLLYIASLLRTMSSTDKEDLLWYLVRSYGFKHANSYAVKILKKGAMAKLSTLPNGWAVAVSLKTGVSIGTGINELVLNINNIQKNAYQLKWAVTAADAYLLDFRIALGLFKGDPVKYYDHFLSVSETFESLVSLEYNALAGIPKALDDSTWNKVKNFFSGSDGYAQQINTIKMLSDLADGYVSEPVKNFNTNYLNLIRKLEVS